MSDDKWKKLADKLDERGKMLEARLKDRQLTGTLRETQAARLSEVQAIVNMMALIEVLSS